MRFTSSVEIFHQEIPGRLRFPWKIRKRAGISSPRTRATNTQNMDLPAEVFSQGHNIGFKKGLVSHL